MSVRIFDTEVSTFADLNKISTADLLDYFNGVTGKTTKQFYSRTKGMQQVWAHIEAELAKTMEAQEDATVPVASAEVPVQQGSPEPERAKTAELPASVQATPAAAPSSAEMPVKEGGLKTQVGALLDFLGDTTKTVAEITQGLKLANEKRARSLIDAARRAGHSIACVGKGTFSLTARAGE